MSTTGRCEDDNSQQMSTISGREVGNNQMCSQASEDLLFSGREVGNNQMCSQASEDLLFSSLSVVHSASLSFNVSCRSFCLFITVSTDLIKHETISIRAETSLA